MATIHRKMGIYTPISVRWFYGGEAQERLIRMIEQIKNIINDAKDRFSVWLDRYEPRKGGNHITERNLSFQFAQSFLEKHPTGMVFMEAPIRNAGGDKKKYNNHLDTYLHSDTFDILLECKNFYRKEHIDAIGADIKRMREVLAEVHDRHIGQKKNNPNPTYGVVLAESWRLENVQWWKSGNTTKAKEKWPTRSTNLPDGWEYGCVEVNRNSGGKTLFWLYGISKKQL